MKSARNVRIAGSATASVLSGGFARNAAGAIHAPACHMIRPYDDLQGLTNRIIRCAIEVHRVLGPGLLESVYHECLLAELGREGLFVQSQQSVAIHYKGLRLQSALWVDLIVERSVIVELKAVESLHPVHEAEASHSSFLLLTNHPLEGKDESRAECPP